MNYDSNLSLIDIIASFNFSFSSEAKCWKFYSDRNFLRHQLFRDYKIKIFDAQSARQPFAHLHILFVIAPGFGLMGMIPFILLISFFFQTGSSPFCITFLLYNISMLILFRFIDIITSIYLWCYYFLFILRVVYFNVFDVVFIKAYYLIACINIITFRELCVSAGQFSSKAEIKLSLF